MAKESTGSLPRLVAAAQAEAHILGAKAIEAEHLLLAIANQPDTPAGETLHRFGLPYERLIELIGGERARSLAFIGIDPAEYGLAARPQSSGKLPLATSSKQVLSKVVHDANWQRSKLNVSELLRAIVSVQAGTVARLLAMARVDRADLLTQLEGRVR